MECPPSSAPLIVQTLSVTAHMPVLAMDKLTATVCRHGESVQTPPASAQLDPAHKRVSSF